MRKTFIQKRLGRTMGKAHFDAAVPSGCLAAYVENAVPLLAPIAEFGFDSA